MSEEKKTLNPEPGQVDLVNSTPHVVERLNVRDFGVSGLGLRAEALHAVDTTNPSRHSALYKC